MVIYKTTAVQESSRVAKYWIINVVRKRKKVKERTVKFKTVLSKDKRANLRKSGPRSVKESSRVPKDRI